MNHEDLPDDGRDTGKIFAVVQLCRQEQIRGCNRDLNEPGDPQQQQVSPHHCLLSCITLTGNSAPPGTAPPRTCGSPPPNDNLCAECPSFPEFSKTTPGAPANARSSCRTCSPRQRRASLARAAPFRPCIHSPGKSFFLLSEHAHPAFLPSMVTTLPRNFSTPFSAAAGMRITSSNNPVIAVRNSSMSVKRSLV